MKASLRTAADTVLIRSPLQPLFLRRSTRYLTILAYHGIDDPLKFAEHLDWLRTHRAPISLQRLFDSLRGHTALPRGAVIVTFDDGDRSLSDTGAELMQSRSVPGVAFVVAGLLDSDEPPWWIEAADLIGKGGRAPGWATGDAPSLIAALKRVPDDERLATIEALRSTASSPAERVSQLRSKELSQLEAAGITVANHSLTHPLLDMCSDAKVEKEIRGSHDILSAVLGHPPTAFAYPNGSFDQRAADWLGALGYRLGVLFDHRLNRLPLPNQLAVSRVRVNSTSSLDRFAAIVSGLHPTVHHILRRA